eukprot:gene38494-35370_t
MSVLKSRHAAKSSALTPPLYDRGATGTGGRVGRRCRVKATCATDGCRTLCATPALTAPADPFFRPLRLRLPRARQRASIGKCDACWT